jgi:methylmalonyl-CoA/ethylmalonyl-CoA epimerase
MDFIQRIDHVGIAVPDLESAVQFYTEVLGMQVVHEETNTEQGVREVMLKANNKESGGALLQLLTPLTAQSPIAQFLDKRGPGLQQLAFTVADVRIAARCIEERGIRVLYDEPKIGTAGSLINFVHPSDTGGVLIELVQPTPTDMNVR